MRPAWWFGGTERSCLYPNSQTFHFSWGTRKNNCAPSHFPQHWFPSFAFVTMFCWTWPCFKDKRCSEKLTNFVAICAIIFYNCKKFHWYVSVLGCGRQTFVFLEAFSSCFQVTCSKSFSSSDLLSATYEEKQVTGGISCLPLPSLR